jgi:hypothetical protein
MFYMVSRHMVALRSLKHSSVKGYINISRYAKIDIRIR